MSVRFSIYCKYLLMLFCGISMFLRTIQAQSINSVTVTSSYVEFDTEKNGEIGMTIHYDFTVHNMTGEDLNIVAFIYNSNGEWVKSFRDDYETTTGNVCTLVQVVAPYDHSHWKDLQLFIPYNAMSVAEFGVKYFYVMAVRRQDGSEVYLDEFHEFDWSSHSPSATIEKVWMEYDVYKDGEKGIYIHSCLTVYNNKGNKSQFICFIKDNNGKYVNTDRSGFRSTNGNLCVYKESDNLYLNSRWSDTKLFLPYSLLPQTHGKSTYNFSFLVRDVNREYDVIGSSEKQYFTYTAIDDEQKEAPTIEWLSDYSSSTSVFVVKVGVKSKCEVTSTSVIVNGDEYKGMQAVQGNGYALTINKTVSLREGSNTIVVSATNAGGTTTRQYAVTYNKSSPIVIQTDNREALVIGNASYSNNPLLNPANDARDVSASLARLGFNVRTVVNGTRREIEEAIVDLGKRAKAGGVALFYYSGHGIQNNGHNYLIPIGANLSSAADLEYECTDVNRVLSHMEESGCKMNIVVLDACRDNPFAKSWTRSTSSSGLSSINAPTGTFIAYATAPGSVAIDGIGKHSPFTEAFLNTLEEPGLALFDFFQQIQQSVQQQTGGQQVPWMASSFLGKFYFNPGK